MTRKERGDIILKKGKKGREKREGEKRASQSTDIVDYSTRYDNTGSGSTRHKTSHKHTKQGTRGDVPSAASMEYGDLVRMTQM